jgi:3-deoxy-manno-octulosonate cytidylyltransferase (CMP-KDO synthetase)
MSLLVVIPARYGSSRFPGKPLAHVSGVPMVQRLWAIARAGAPGARVVVATDDHRIADAVAQFGGEPVMTSPECRNGTERAAAVLEQAGEDVEFLINLQGDAVLTPPKVVAAIADAAADVSIQMATPATIMEPAALVSLREAKARGEVGGTTVVCAVNGDALYFSKTIIPYIRDGVDVPVYRHIGLYGYRPEVLRRLVALEPGPLERAEQLEQLRALENNIPIRVVPVAYEGRTHWGIDTQQDLARCERLIEAEGELLSAYDGTGTRLTRS